MGLGAAPGGLPPVGAQAVLFGMQQFNQSVRQVSMGLNQINSASLALERNSVLATTRMTSAFASMSSAYVTGGARMAATFGVVNAGLAGLAVAAVAATATAVGVAASFEKTLKPVQVFGDLTAEQTAKVGDHVLEMSRKWGIATGALNAGETALVKAGASIDDMNSGLSDAITLLTVASEGELTQAESANIVTQAMRSWKLPASEAINFVNALVGATNASTASFKDMTSGLGQSQAMAANLNITYGDQLSMLGALNDENIRGERAGTALRNLYVRMLNPTKEVTGVMLRYGISLSDSNGNMISAREYVERLTNAFSDQAVQARGLTKAQVESDLATIGMSRSLLGIVALANQGTEGFDKYRAAIDKTDVRKIAEAFNSTTIKQADIFAKNINAIAIAFGGPFNESLGRAIHSMNTWIQSINLAQVRAIGTLIRDQIGGALNYVAGLVKQGAGSIGAIFGNSGASGAVGNAILGTITSLIVKVQQVQAIWTAIWSNPNLTAGATSILASLVKLADAVLPRVQLALATIGEILAYVIPRAIAAIPWDTIGTTVETVVNETIKFIDGGYKQVAQDIYNTVVSIVNGVIDAVSTAIGAVATAASNVVTGVVDVVKNIVNAVLNTLGSIVSGTMNFLDPFAANIGSLLEFVLDAAHRVVNAIGHAFEPLANYISNDLPTAFGPLISALKTVMAVSIVFSRVFDKVTGDTVKSAYEGWSKAIPLTIDDLLSAFWKFVGLLGTGVKNIVSSIELVANGVNVFLSLWIGAMRDSAKAAQGFVSFVTDTFDGLFTWLGEQPIVGKFVKDLYTSFATVKKDIDSIFDGIGNAPTDAFQHIQNTIDKIMSGIDLTVQDVRANIDRTIGAIGEGVASVGGIVQQAFDDAKAVVAGILPTISNAGEGIRKFLETMMDSARARIAGATPEALKFLDTIKGILAGISSIPGTALPGTAGPTKLKGGNTDTEGVGAPPADQAKVMLDYVTKLLHAVPALTEEFAKFVAELALADPGRLNGMVAAITAQRGVLQDIGRIRLDILQTEIKIAEVDAKLDAIHREQQRIQIAMQQASLPFEQQLLALRTQSARVELAMLPIQNQIADIDKSIALLQRENLSLRMRELQIRSQMMPIENQIADIDKAIAETQRENFALSQQIAKVQLDMLPTQFAIEDLQKRIAANNQENFDITRRRLLLEQESLPLRRQIEDIDGQIAHAQKTNYDDVAKQLQLQYDMLDARQSIADIDAAIAQAGRTNYDIVKQLAELDQKALPYKQKIADIEQKITDLIDKRAQLERDRTSLIAEHDLKKAENSIKTIDKQLDDLWSKFNTTKGADRTALIPQIIDLEKQKKQLEDSLKPAQALVDKLHEQQSEIDYNNNLAKIGLQIQEAEQEALLKPINAQIDALKRQQDQAEATQAVVIAGLNAQKAAIEDTIALQQQQLTVLEQYMEQHRLLVAITVAGLEKQKQGLEDILWQYDDQLKSIKRLEEEQKLAAQIANTYLEEELQKQQKILDQYQAILTTLQRQQQAYTLRNEIIRLGLEQEKARLESILLSWQAQLTAVERERAAEELRHNIAVTSLLQQKQNLENLLLPLENAKTAIERQTAAITLQQQLATAAYQEQLLALQKSELENTLYKNQLESIRAGEQTRLGELIAKFQEALTKSGAFTAAEVTESIKRLGLWQGETDKLSELKTTYANLQTLLSNTAPYSNAQAGINNLGNSISGPNSNIATLSNTMNSVQINTKSLSDNMALAAPNMNTAAASANLLQAAFANMYGALAGNPTLEALYVGLVNSFINGAGGWNDQVTRVSSLKDQFNSLRDAINGAAAALGSYGTVAIKNIATEVAASAAANAYFTAARNSGSGIEAAAGHAYGSVLDILKRKVIGYAEGGVVPGRAGDAQMAIVHGGETVVPFDAATRWDDNFQRITQLLAQAAMFESQEIMLLRMLVNYGAVAVALSEKSTGEQIQGVAIATQHVQVAMISADRTVVGLQALALQQAAFASAVMTALAGSMVLATQQLSIGVMQLQLQQMILPALVRLAEARGYGPQGASTTTVQYNFSASYERQQDPITASMDMRSLIEMTR